MESVNTVVIGAGQAGLAASYHLTQHGVEHLVLERGRVGERWRSERWDGFVLNTPNWGQQLPGFHYAGDEPHAFAPLGEVISYLEGYAQSFDAPVREETPVTAVRRRENGFHVEAGDESFAARHVVVAAGSYQEPTANPLSAELPADVFQLHTSRYRRPDRLPDGAVLVVGSGQSGCQIADELIASGRTVFLSVGKCPWVFRRDRGHDVLHWLLHTGLAEETVDTLPSPAARLVCNPPVSGNDGGHECHPRWLAARGAVLVGRLIGVSGHRLSIDDNLGESLAFGEEWLGNIRKRIDDHIAERGLDLPEREPDEPCPPQPAITELDLGREGISTVLWANGFRPDHAWIQGVEADAQGWPVHVRGASTVPGLYFVGLHWLHKRKSSLFVGVGEDAGHIVSEIAKVSG